MNMLLFLLARIAGGEKYEKTSKEDVIIWLSFLAGFPITFSIGWLFHPLMNTAPLWGI